MPATRQVQQPAPTTPVTTRTLLDAKIGTVLTVELRSGRRIVGKLKHTPRLMCVGKPGIHRVRLDVADLSKQLSDNATIFHMLDNLHTVSGDRVVAFGGAQIGSGAAL